MAWSSIKPPLHYTHSLHILRLTAPEIVCIYYTLKRSGYYAVSGVDQGVGADGWTLHSVTGSHHHFKHPTKPGKVTLPHPVKDMHPGEVRETTSRPPLRPA
ncbi:type II toxin-antitoxin system HicA family toxin [Bosea sp. LC85]|uniref:type II toxin-antitoxin system HicA family toxin n=1 Tax=Bosea sp. LC85 TaxID=1502851 RepID=UPI00126A4BE7|nr:type II toxin-antitoxin system HicA family toxin [Bosea sp. LC85]